MSVEVSARPLSPPVTEITWVPEMAGGSVSVAVREPSPALLVLVNIGVDVCYALLDPRVRYDGA